MSDKTVNSLSRLRATQSSSDIPVCVAVEGEHPEHLVQSIGQNLQRCGYCVVQGSSNDVSVLKTVVKLFGDAQSHLRANGDGVVEVGSKGKLQRNGIDAAQYLGTGNDGFSPHTDGSYLNGLVRTQTGIRRVGPPKLVALQCVRPATKGGENILVDGARVLEGLISNDPIHAKVLLSRGCVSFCRDEQIAMDFPVFERSSLDSWRVRFRYDAMMYAPPWSVPTVKYLQQAYFNNRQYVNHIALEEGQILLIDNFRILHGREAFASGLGNQQRLVRRMWVKDDDDSRFENLGNQKVFHRAFDRYKPYQIIERESENHVSLRVGLGIRLSDSVRALLNEN